MSQKVISYFFFLFLILISISVSAQTKHNFSFILKTNVGNDSPYWFHTNRDGIIDDSGLGSYLIFDSAYEKKFKNDFTVSYKISPVVRWSSNSKILFPLINTKISYKKINIQIGRFNYEELHRLEELRTGSFVQSRNAIPIPKIELKTDFIHVPFTNELAKVKGTFTHGWFEKDRTVESPLLHQKTFYLLIGRENKFNIYAGLVHSVMWGGFSNIESIGNIPESFNDFIRSVFLGRGSDDAPLNDQNYYQGNQLGIYDLGISFKKRDWDIELYKQFLFEDYDGVVLRNFQDGIIGVTLEKMNLHNSRKLVEGINYEYIYTKFQNGRIHISPNSTTSGRDDYYSHTIYQNGWTSFGRVIGNPLITVRQNRDINEYLIENNRVVAHHIGLRGDVLKNIDYIFKATFSNNHGRYLEEQRAENYSQEYKFDPPLKQLSLYLMLTKKSEKWQSIDFSFAIAGDIGELYQNRFGIQFGIKKGL
ncbi:MAG: capsule assembly Wzi family protein [Balneolaceae bacterium]